MALWAVTKGLDHGGEHINPILHLYREDGQTNAELDSNGLRTGGEVLQQQKNLAPQGWELARRYLGSEIVCDLVMLVALRKSIVEVDRGGQMYEPFREE